LDLLFIVPNSCYILFLYVSELNPEGGYSFTNVSSLHFVLFLRSNKDQSRILTSLLLVLHVVYICLQARLTTEQPNLHS